MTATRPRPAGPERAREHDRRDVADRERDDRRADDAHRAAGDRRPRAAGMVGALTPLTVVSARPPHGTGLGFGARERPANAPGSSTIVRQVRILLVTPGLGLGGSERLTLAYARGLVARGHDVLIVHGPPERFRAPPTCAGVALHRVARAARARSSFTDWFRVAARARRRTSSRTSRTRNRCARRWSSRSPRRARPLLATVHGIEESEERRAALVLRAIARARDRGLRRLGRRRAAPPPGAADRARAARRRRRGARARGARCRRSTRFPSAGRCVVCVGRHFPVKGVDVLVEAFPQVLAAVPEAGLLLVGGGPDHEALIARGAELGISHAVHFGGLRAQRRRLDRARPTSSCCPRAARACPSPRSRRSRSSAPSSPPRSAGRPTSCAPATPAGSCRPSSPPRSPRRSSRRCATPTSAPAARRRGPRARGARATPSTR